VSDFRSELEELINSQSMENGSNTPDFILASFLLSCLHAFDASVKQRDEWYGNGARGGFFTDDLGCVWDMRK
jgi:hypothetical protein